jgi:hypothetical protein
VDKSFGVRWADAVQAGQTDLDVHTNASTALSLRQSPTTGLMYWDTVILSA